MKISSVCVKIGTPIFRMNNRHINQLCHIPQILVTESFPTLASPGNRQKKASFETMAFNVFNAI
jgi:hypothetical protein